jgi:hypothetical protein
MRANVDNFSGGRVGEGYSQSAPTLRTALLIPDRFIPEVLSLQFLPLQHLL